jgi:hypothetical protein
MFNGMGARQMPSNRIRSYIHENGKFPFCRIFLIKKFFGSIPFRGNAIAAGAEVFLKKAPGCVMTRDGSSIEERFYEK